MKKIALSGKYGKGKFTLVDDWKYEEAIKRRWVLSVAGYAVSRSKRNAETVYLHRLINNTPKGFHTDHINRNKLDNQEANLRTTTCSENTTNTKVRLDNTSGCKGVSLYKRHNVYHAYINKNKKRITLGHFKNIDDAIKARQEAEGIYHAI